MGYPIGAVIHFTAGRASTEDDAAESLRWLLKNKMKAVVIGPTGRLHFPPNWDTLWGPHAGPSKHPVLGGALSRKLLGIEVANEGKLTKKGDKFYTWFGTVVPKERVNHYPRDVGNIQAGYYAAFTKPQMDALVNFLFDLKRRFNQFNFDYVLGHDEVATPRGRKNDPGGSLGMTMEEFRNFLKKHYLPSGAGNVT